MIKRVLRRIGSLMLASVFVLNMLPPMVALAATTLDSTKLPSGLTASYEGDTSNSKTITWTPSVTDNVGSISGTAVAGSKCSGMSYTYYACDTTLTLTNTSGSDKLLEFSYAVEVSSASCQVTIAGTTYKENKTETYSAALKSNSSITINLKTEAADSSTAKVSITNLKLTSADQDITVTFDTVTGGSYTVNGSAITETTTKTNVATTVYELVATPASGYSFCGWMNAADNTLLATSKTASLTPKDGMVIKPVFASSSETWFLASGKILYNDLNSAANHASSADTKTVVLMNSGVLAAGDYTIPAGVTLVIPFDDWHTVVTTNPAVVTSYSTSSAPSAFRTLTMASGAKLALNGSLSIGGTLAASQTYGYNGLPTGKLGYIKMEQGSSIEANNGSFMYVIGYIYGDGSVNVNSGATVYECFQIRDFRGGNATGTMRSAKKVFPLSQYYVQNIEVPMTLNAGAIVNGLSAFNINNGFQIPEIPFIGNSSSYMFQITNGSIVKDYIESTDRLMVQINGSLSVSPFTFEVPGFGGMASIDTSNFTLPINQNITVEVATGKSLTISQDISLLPGAEILVNESATCTITAGKKVIVYDSANWGNYCGEKHHATGDNVPLKPLLFVAGGTPKVNRFTTDATALADASVKINGIVDASAGSLYVTDGGAQIYSTANGELRLGKAPGELSTYQATQSGSSISNVTIKAYAAKLKQENGNYLDTAGTTAATYNYDSASGAWRCATHTDTDNNHICEVCGMDPCSACADSDGDYACDICGKDLCEHTELTLVEAKDGYCGEQGNTAYYTCVCGKYFADEAAQEEIEKDSWLTDSLGHTPMTAYEATESTCTTPGNAAYWQCERCEKYFSDEAGETEIADLEAWLAGDGKIESPGHTYGDVTYDWTGYTACVATRNCTVESCNAETEGHTETANATIKNEVTKEATCSAPGERTYTATFAVEWASEQTNTETIAIDENAHAWENDCDTTCNNDPSHTREATHSYDSAVTAPTCTNGGFTTHTCTICGNTYKDTETSALSHDEVTHDAKAPTCTEIGWDAYVTCSRCDYTTYAEKAALGHTEAAAVKENEVAATCGKAGSYDSVVKCSICGTELSRETITVSATGAHTWNDGVITKEATCKETGVKTFTCSVCQDTRTAAVDMIAHNYKTLKQDEVNHWYECTCGEENNTAVHADTNKDHKCDTCEYVISQCADNNSDHNCDTCGEAMTECADENTDHKCDICGTAMGTHEAAEGKHTCDYCNQTVTECSDGDDEDHKCDICGAEGISDHSHTAEVTQPTCTDNGYTTYTCACGHSYTDNVVPAAHTIAQGAAQAKTCAQDGWEAYEYCTKCDYSTKVVIPAGHTLTQVEAKTATCTEAGWAAYEYCTECDYTTKVTIEATGHTNVDAVKENEKAASCTADGSYDSVVYCSVCGAEISRETVTVDKLGHTAGEAVEENRVEATATEDGSYDSVAYCTVCGTEISRDTVVIPATGEPEEEFVPKVGNVTDYGTPNESGSVTIKIGTASNAPEATVTAPTTGWVIGENTFTVTSTDDIACVVIVKDADGDDTRLSAVTDEETNIHSYTAVLDEDCEIIVAVKGDINGNGRLDALDARQVVVAVTSGTDELKLLILDVNNNNRPDALDARQIAMAISGTRFSW